MARVSAFLLGIIFAVGLGVSGMTQPAKIIGFLDVTGNWDPSLLFVMVGAVGVTAATFPWILRRSRPLIEKDYRLPIRSAVDRPLVFGSSLFGIGWGLSGYCPGPALVSSVTGNEPVLVFVFAMISGLIAARWLRDSLPYIPEERERPRVTELDPGGASGSIGAGGMNRTADDASPESNA
jgi:uncharacterized protein